MTAKSVLAMTVSLSLASLATAAMPNASNPNPSRQIQDEMEVQIKGQFKGRFLVKKIVAPVTMNLEKLQDFPEDPSQRILLTPIPIALSSEFNARREVKGHAPFYPWITPIPESPFLRMTPPKDKKLTISSWMFEVFNPQGQTIFRQRGTNELPDELIWEGQDSEKKFAVVNRLYSAQLTWMGPDGNATVIQGDSVILPAIAFGSEESETLEFSLARLFVAGRAELSLEGQLLLSRLQERLRERGLTNLHVRIAGDDKNLSVQREEALVLALEKALRLSPGQIEHDSTQPTIRGEIAVFWLKKGGPKS